MKTHRFYRRYQYQIDRVVDLALTLLYITIVITGIGLALHVERIFNIF